MSEITNAVRDILGTVRASSWKSFFGCELSWYYSNVMGLRIPSTGVAATGTAIHAGTAVFDAARLRGEEPSVEEAVAVAMASLHNPEEEVAWDDVKDFKDAEAIVIKLTTKYCNEFAPTRHYVAIETRCAALDIRTDYGVVRTTGTIDRVRELPDLRRGVTDLKSGKQATEKNDDGTRRAAIGAHHLQVGIYTLMAEVALNEQLEAPAEIVGLSTTKEAPIAAADIPDVKTALLGKEGYVGMIEMAAKTLKDGLFRPNPGAFTCTKTWCAGYPRCPYHA